MCNKNGYYRKNLVSLKNIDIRSSNGPRWPEKCQLFQIWTYCFLTITRPFFVQSDWFFMVTQETIIYRSEMRNHDFDAFFKKGPIVSGKMGVAATVAPKGLGSASRSEQKVGALVEPFRSIVILKTCFHKFRDSSLKPLPPFLNKKSPKLIRRNFQSVVYIPNKHA